VQGAILFHVEATSENCPQHIPIRYSETEVAAMMAPLQARIAGKLEVGEGDAGAWGRSASSAAPAGLAARVPLKARGDEMCILDDKGHVVACVEDRVSAVGGEAREGEAGPSYRETRRKLGVPRTQWTPVGQGSAHTGNRARATRNVLSTVPIVAPER